MSAVISDMTNIVATIGELEKKLVELKALVAGGAAATAAVAGAAASGGKKVKKVRKPRDPDAPKKEPNDWIKWTQRVREALKAAQEAEDAKPEAERRQYTFKLAKDVFSFAKSLLAEEKEGEWTDEEIQEARLTWTPPVKEDEKEVLRKELQTVAQEAIAAGKNPHEAIDEWSKKRMEATAAAAAAEPPVEKKKRGPKPLSEEEKAKRKEERKAKAAAAAAKTTDSQKVMEDLDEILSE